MKTKHVLKSLRYDGGTERDTATAYCGVEEECSGSGDHGMVRRPGDSNCAECVALEHSYDSIEASLHGVLCAY